MANLFDHIFGPGSKAIRRGASCGAVKDASGNWVIEASAGEATTLSSEGSIDTMCVVARLHCGHFAHDGLGGQCGEPGCAKVSCKQCFAQARCSECFKPLCLEHLHKLETERGVLLVCGRCRDALKRKYRWQATMKCILRPFIGHAEKEGP